MACRIHHVAYVEIGRDDTVPRPVTVADEGPEIAGRRLVHTGG
jgi:hypothetical protein